MDTIYILIKEKGCADLESLRGFENNYSIIGVFSSYEEAQNIITLPGKFLIKGPYHLNIRPIVDLPKPIMRSFNPWEIKYF